MRWPRTLPDLPEQGEPGHTSMVLVVTRDLVDPETTVPLLRLAPKGTAAGRRRPQPR